MGEKSYAVESAIAPNGDIGVRMSGRSSSTLGRVRGWSSGAGIVNRRGRRFPRTSRQTVRAGGTSSIRRTRSTTAPGTRSRRGSTPRTATVLPGDRRLRPRRTHRRGRLGRGCRDRDDAARAVVGHVRHARRDRQGRATCGGAGGCRHLHGDCNDPTWRSGARTRRTFAARPRSPTSSWVRCSTSVAALDEADGGETLVVLTADHGATYGEDFYGKTGPVGISNSNWYYAPVGVFDAGSPGAFVPPTDPLYNLPSPALQPLDRHGRPVLLPVDRGRDMAARSLGGEEAGGRRRDARACPG